MIYFQYLLIWILNIKQFLIAVLKKTNVWKLAYIILADNGTSKVLLCKNVYILTNDGYPMSFRIEKSLEYRFFLWHGVSTSKLEQVHCFLSFVQV